jgi:hypothetical protein
MQTQSTSRSGIAPNAKTAEKENKGVREMEIAAFLALAAKYGFLALVINKGIALLRKR